MAVVLIRIGIIIEMAPSLPEGLALSPRPVLYGLLWAAAAATSVTVAMSAARRRHPSGRHRGMVADTAVTVGFLLAGSFVVAAEFRINSWVGWPPGYALTVLLTIGGLRNRRTWSLCVLAVVVAYLGYAIPGLGGSGMVGSIIGNLLTFVVMGSIARFTVGFLRRTSADADEARTQAELSAQAAEAAKARLTMHNATTVMQLLAQSDLPGELRRELQVQAVAEAARMRAYLRDDTPLRSEGQHQEAAALRDVVTEAMAGFADLGLEPSVQLADQIVLNPRAANAVRDAVTALLHNVRVHADATTVIVHAEGADDGSWAVTIADDGRGYQPSLVMLGVGIREQVIGQLAVHRIAVTMKSSPGAGTRVVLRWPGDHG